ncbi:MAG: Glu/Leu/Phe/Val dehydrogenase dimerization domain-containing protein [Planctomycetota bacterium]
MTLRTEEIRVEGYERVVRATDDETGLRAIISVHDTTLGPALGGMRMWNYASDDAAMTDVLRLSEGMTYKSAIARTGLGGGKSVIIGDAKKIKTPELMRSMGRFVDSLGGLYITAEDVNIGVRDLECVSETTRHVTGLSREKGGSGNPSPYTAHGVFLGIKTCLADVFGSDDPRGRHVAIQGVGAVARTLIDKLIAAGATVTATDIDEEKIALVRENHPQVAWVEPDAIYDVACDVFAPCALGAILDDGTLPRLSCKIVAGAANNQLADDRHGEMLLERGILYAPDFVINAGGIVNVSCEFEPGGYDEDVAMKKISNIAEALRSTFAHARAEGIDTNRAAEEVARKIVADARAAK